MLSSLFLILQSFGIFFILITVKVKLYFITQEEQKSMQKTVRKIIDEDINPYVDEWEAGGQYPAKKVRFQQSKGIRQ